jgi:hypothetical protein
MTTTSEYCVTSENDCNKIQQDCDKIENLHLCLNKSTNMSHENFCKLIDCLSKCNKEKIFKMDISNWQLDDDKVNRIASVLKNWNLYHFHLNMSNVNLTDKQFECLLNPLKGMPNLEILHLIMENINLNDYKRECLRRLVKELKNLRSVHINIRSNKITKDALSEFRSIVEPIQIRQLLWDDECLI